MQVKLVGRTIVAAVGTARACAVSFRAASVPCVAANPGTTTTATSAAATPGMHPMTTRRDGRFPAETCRPYNDVQQSCRGETADDPRERCGQPGRCVARVLHVRDDPVDGRQDVRIGVRCGVGVTLQDQDGGLPLGEVDAVHAVSDARPVGSQNADHISDLNLHRGSLPRERQRSGGNRRFHRARSEDQGCQREHGGADREHDAEGAEHGGGGECAVGDPAPPIGCLGVVRHFPPPSQRR